MTKAEILAVRALHAKEGRNEQQLFVCEGAKLVDEILHSSLTVRHIFSTIERADAEKITSNEMSRISALKTPTEILALVEIPHYTIRNGGLNLVLDGVQDPGNLGTIIRIADWFGIRDIYCSHGSADCFNSKVVQATMGAIARVRVHYTDLVKLLESKNAPIYGTFLEGENIYNSTLIPEGYIVMGSEGRGVSDEIKALVTHRLYIPPFPASGSTVESLNVAVATAIVCSEFRRL